jgi:hypothetical protein
MLRPLEQQVLRAAPGFILSTMVGLCALSTTACGYTGGTGKGERPKRQLEFELTALTESRAPLSGVTVEVDIGSYRATSTRGVSNDQGHLSLLFQEKPVGTAFLWDSLLPPSPLATHLRLILELPSYHPDAIYPIRLETKPEPVERQRAFAPPARIDPDLDAVRAGDRLLYTRGAAYDSSSGVLRWVELGGDGTETRLVPATWKPKTYQDEDLTIPAGVPAAPRLQITTRFTSLGGARDRISMELVVIYHDDE